jgi:hypothetical protein
VGGAVHGRATATEDDAPARLARDPVARAAADAIEEGRETFGGSTGTEYRSEHMPCLPWVILHPTIMRG